MQRSRRLLTRHVCWLSRARVLANHAITQLSMCHPSASPNQFDLVYYILPPSIATKLHKKHSCKMGLNPMLAKYWRPQLS